MLTKQGVKLWTDGSPWVGNIAISFPYLDTEGDPHSRDRPSGNRRRLQHEPHPRTARRHPGQSRPPRLADGVPANGDLAIDLALDAYEAAPERHNLVGSDHRWRLEHAGAGTRRQFDRAARLGVHVSMAPFQYYYWGDLLDGQMFAPEHGSPWQSSPTQWPPARACPSTTTDRCRRRRRYSASPPR